MFRNNPCNLRGGAWFFDKQFPLTQLRAFPVEATYSLDSATLHPNRPAQHTLSVKKRVIHLGV